MSLYGYIPKTKKAIWWKPRPKVSSRKRIRAFSQRRIDAMVLYKKVRAEYLRTHIYCECCVARNLPKKIATELHHTRGRLASLLTDTRFFKSACSECHLFVHANIAEARALGLICAAGQWNRSPK